MKLIVRVFVFAGLVGTGIWLWLYFHPSPQEAIRRQLDQLAAAACFDGPENVVVTGVAASKVASFFANEVRMNIEPRGFFEEDATRSDIAQFCAALRARAGIRSLQVKFFDPIITLSTNNESAEVELTVNAETAGERHLLVQELKLTLKFVDKKWLIVRVETVKTLN
ncbi:MAG: hypothetical protein QM813_18265 [Verrucomicrobiota bacterium]